MTNSSFGQATQRVSLECLMVSETRSAQHTHTHTHIHTHKFLDAGIKGIVIIVKADERGKLIILFGI